MRNYPPFHLTLSESQDLARAEQQASRIEVSDETLIQYASRFIEVYRNTIETFFPEIAPYLSTYSGYPYKIDIIRMDKTGVFIFYQSSEENSVTVTDFKDISPPVDYNLFDLKQRFDPCWGEFDFSNRTYSQDEADVRGRYTALNDILQVFWLLLDTENFVEICLKLIAAEIGNEVNINSIKNDSDLGIDLESNIVLNEPAQFRREEKWGFIFKHFKENRITPQLLTEIEKQLDNKQLNLDIVCLITSGDVTSIGHAIAIKNPKLRIWDRNVLNQLINKHLSIIQEYFQQYKVAKESIASYLEIIRRKRYQEFKSKLEACPTGQESFSQYEELCKEILDYLFDGELKPFATQNRTHDETQRRDIVYRNLRNSKFFERIFKKFNADFIIFDPKNYGNEITKNEFESISKYTNKAVGKLVVLISRKGANESALDTQLRLYRDDDKVVLSINDLDMLEMISRKERGESPQDLLEDLLDQLLLRY